MSICPSILCSDGRDRPDSPTEDFDELSCTDKNSNVRIDTKKERANPFQKVIRRGCRKIGYAYCEAVRPEDRKVAILWFYAMSGHSTIVESAAESFSNYRATVICVDRPGIGDTDFLQHEQSDFSQQQKDHRKKKENIRSSPTTKAKGSNLSLNRIQGHAEDVLAVLHTHKVARVYLLGVCLGHVYAVQVARQLIKRENEDENSKISLKLEAIALVAPFVSTACPDSWHLARLGSNVPSFFLSVATKSLVSLGGLLISNFLTADRIRQIVEEEEEVVACEWKDEDYEQFVSSALCMYRLTSKAKATEAQLGADPSWQCICDDFAEESGYGLILDSNGSNNGPEKEVSKSPPSSFSSNQNSKLPIRIYASREDHLSSLESIKWIARRCYGGPDNIVIQEHLHSHQLMTMLAGPPSNPVLMHKIAQSWGIG